MLRSLMSLIAVAMLVAQIAHARRPAEADAPVGASVPVSPPASHGA